MRGNITRRGKSSWRIKFDVGTNDDGSRKIQYETVHGTRKQAEATLAKRLTELAEGRLNSAVKAKKIARSPIADIETTPKAKRRDEIVVLDEPELGALLNHLKGHSPYLPALVAASTECAPRRGSGAPLARY